MPCALSPCVQVACTINIGELVYRDGTLEVRCVLLRWPESLCGGVGSEGWEGGKVERWKGPSGRPCLGSELGFDRSEAAGCGVLTLTHMSDNSYELDFLLMGPHKYDVTVSHKISLVHLLV